MFDAVLWALWFIVQGADRVGTLVLMWAWR